jgi:glycosyltransferase involved in cell wall biosynthesis
MMTDKPLVSVLVLAFNSSATILQTLDSILDQTYPNIEVIIHDDCSTDATYNIAENWLIKNSANLNRCSIIGTDLNRGLVSSILRAFDISTGSWIKVIAADDVLREDALELFMREADANPGRKWFFSLCTPFSCEIEHICQISHLPSSPELDFVRFLSSKNNTYLLKLAISRNVYPAPSSFFSRDFFQNNCSSLSGFIHMEDYPLWVSALIKGYTPIWITAPLVGYRQGSNTLSSPNQFIPSRLIPDLLRMPTLFTWLDHPVLRIYAEFARARIAFAQLSYSDRLTLATLYKLSRRAKPILARIYRSFCVCKRFIIRSGDRSSRITF